jgi:hypothetical protein
VKEKLLGEDHPDTAVTLNNLAALYSKQARYAEAEANYRRAFSIFEAKFGLKHPSTQTCAANLSNLSLKTTRQTLPE